MLITGTQFRGLALLASLQLFEASISSLSSLLFVSLLPASLLPCGAFPVAVVSSWPPRSSSSTGSSGNNLEFLSRADGDRRGHRTVVAMTLIKELNGGGDTTSATTANSNIRTNVQEYYGKTLQSSTDLQTNACCTAGAPPKYIQEALKRIHPTVLSKYYGCGLTLPQYDITGCRILDLGCGAGRDVYLASQLVGPTGSVVGVDMTPEQLAVAKEYQAHHAEQFGYHNTAFHQGYLEQLEDIAELQESSFDIIISNCVINLCTDKRAVLQACRRLLKPGGELYFSDVYASCRVPTRLQQDPILWGECLSGALYWNDFHNLAKQVGFPDPRLVEDAPITVQNKQVQALIEEVGPADLVFFSATYRLFALDETLLEPACEDYGQAVIYHGSIPRAPTQWKLDKGHIFVKGKVHPVCGNTYNMLFHNPQLKEHFQFIGDFATHYGIFPGCGGAGSPYDTTTTGSSSANTKGSGACC